MKPLFLERKIKIKAVPRAVGIEYPKVHDVSDVFPGIGERFPDWFRAEIDFLMESSKVLFKKREPSSRPTGPWTGETRRTPRRGR